MEFEGMVYRVLPVVKGQGAKGEWTKQEVVFELPGEFSRKVCVAFWGDKAQDAASLREGDVVSVSINLESREHNGRWFTEARAWKFTRNPSSATSAQTAAPAAPSAFYEAPNPTFSAPAAPAPAYTAPAPSAPPADQMASGGVDDLPF